MKFVFSTTILASVVAPAVSFSYLDTLAGSAPAPAAYAPAPAAPAAPVPAAPAAATYESGFGDVELSSTSSGYLDSMNIGEQVSGPGLLAFKDSLASANPISGPGMLAFKDSIAATSTISGGSGLNTHVDTLSPSNFDGKSYSPFGESAAVSFSGSSASDGVSFTLETGDISGLVDGLSAGGTLRLSGSIDNISYN
mmetsp:Transcript_6209/g.12832  ORF Transcript_6209/g.12832 Transcript_6209/m.12832 type:complete len:196 (+) Transcript_6209:24-611(+)|eukprot:CAMPEP_0197269206 /NCGR_PEP_ID=MMETSP1432-20130617/4794_1 /TAXON_ID=44447 /ORGANISM="Pseudo-nitzschia delicatissima, Strain UNC1205" /LENGTH=195 /DNA_ID=CAMNT_0042734327 /DNA_START=24 /DNA_END=611 /DNA_ORIENTATION=+